MPVVLFCLILGIASPRGDEAIRGSLRTSQSVQRGRSESAWGPWDTNLSLRGHGAELRLRMRARQLTTAAAWRARCGVRLMAGELAIGWATGALLGDETGDRLETRNRLKRTAAKLLQVRLTTALRDRAQRGVVIAVQRKRFELSSWALAEQVGLACGGRIGGLALQRSEHGHLTWSAVLRTSPGRKQADHILWECCGSGDSHCGWGGAFRLGSRAPIGSLRGFFRYAPGVAHPRMSPDGWRVTWNAPLLAGLAPEIAVHVLKRGAPTKRLPTIERRATFAIAAEPWAGAHLRCAFASTRVQECRGEPDNSEVKMIASSARSVGTLLARVHLAPAVEFQARYRQSSATLQTETPVAPWPLQLRPADCEEAVSEHESPARSWEGANGGLLWSALRWHWGAGWFASVAVAATPDRAGGLSAVPVRIPPGRSQWRTLGAGRWFAEGWISWRNGRGVYEVVLRSVTGPTPGEIVLQWMLGWSWRIGGRDGSLERSTPGG